VYHQIINSIQAPACLNQENEETGGRERRWDGLSLEGVEKESGKKAPRFCAWTRIPTGKIR
jgi:hypothetical protein